MFIFCRMVENKERNKHHESKDFFYSGHHFPRWSPICHKNGAYCDFSIYINNISSLWFYDIQSEVSMNMFGGISYALGLESFLFIHIVTVSVTFGFVPVLHSIHVLSIQLDSCRENFEDFCCLENRDIFWNFWKKPGISKLDLCGNPVLSLFTIWALYLLAWSYIIHFVMVYHFILL